MRKSALILSIVSVAALACAMTLTVSAQRQGPEGFLREGIRKMPNAPGPAPKRDMSGVWVGPLDNKPDPVPPMTPAGQALFKERKSYGEATRTDGLGSSNDPFITCDPLGFPRNLLAHAVSSRGRFIVASAPNRMLLTYEQQRMWREVWLDGRALPKAVDVRGAPVSRYYGYSVGRWENDTTFVIDTTGVDERAWLDEVGRPRSSSARIQERYERVDEHYLQLTVTMDDPKFYTKPWTWMRARFYTVAEQEFAETLCIPSEAIEYRDLLARPSGIQTP
ncbi:MAG: hypothetical protein AB7I50_13185 [Vicinamibacterales bacterium]